MTDSPSTREVPRFPIYIHSSMMMSFLAYLDDGVSNEAEIQSQSQNAKSKQGSAGLSAKLSAFSTIFGLTADARASRETSTSDTEIRQERKQHTNASLFNLLYDVLSENNAITEIRSTADLADLSDGSIVEIDGRFMGNPLEDSFGMMRKLLNISDSVQEAVDKVNTASKQNKKQNSRSGNPALRAAAEEPTEEIANPMEIDSLSAALLRAVLADLGDSPVADYVVDGPEGMQLVVSVVRDECPPGVLELMRASKITVIGKVTNLVLDESEGIDLMRRSSMSVLDNDDDSLAPLLDLAGGHGTQDRFVDSPAVQIIPMGIFC